MQLNSWVCLLVCGGDKVFSPMKIEKYIRIGYGINSEYELD